MPPRRLRLTVLVLWGLTTSFYVGPSFGQAPTRSFRDVAEEVGQSIVQVVVTVSYQLYVPAVSGQSSEEYKTIKARSSGTGFFIDADWHVVTAYHVVDVKKIQRDLEIERDKKYKSLRTNRKPSIVHGSVHIAGIEIFSFAPNSDGSNGIHIYDVRSGYDSNVFKTDEANDIAILDTPELKFISQLTNPYETRTPGEIHTNRLPDENGRASLRSLKIAKLQLKRPHKTDAVSVSGYPAFQELNGGQIPSLIVDSGTISDNYYITATNVDTYLASVVSNLGDSGAPLFNNSDGAVLGFVTANLHNMSGNKSGEVVVIPVAAVQKLLR